MSELYIGLMSGTSVDGIDVVLADLQPQVPALIATHAAEIPPAVRQAILALCHPGSDELNRLGELDVLLGHTFANAVCALLQKQALHPSQIRAIGSHGQTIRHHPARCFTLQIGDPNIIAANTGITTVADFRRRDMAHGGQGAPLTPAFHQAMFAAKKNRVIVNIGGIANITVLPEKKDATVIGFDTGPGNTLLDAWAEKHLQTPYDKNGEWAASGTCQSALLERLWQDPYFSLAPPKSTGREYFNLAWLNSFLSADYHPADVQATLVELTAKNIIYAVEKILPESEILICGGGAHNTFLIQRLRALYAKPQLIHSTEAVGMHPDWIEALAFAWLAKQTMEKKHGNLPAVTGATQSSILGGIYYA